MRLPEYISRRIPELSVDNPSDKDTQPPPELKDSFRASAEVTRHHAKSFYFASFFLSREKRQKAYAVYAYCRYIDDLIDEQSTLSEKASLDTLLSENREILAGRHAASFSSAFRWVSDVQSIPVELMDELVEGCCRDEETVRIKTRQELWEYCYLVASVVGLMMCRVFGVTSAEAYPRAVEMGLAMQLTNILRDIKEDYGKDRIYLPAEDLAERNLDIDSLLEQGPSEDWQEYLSELIAIAREWYRSSETGLQYLQNKTCARTGKIMGRVYAGILTEIEKKSYDVRSRHYVRFSRKIRLALSR